MAENGNGTMKFFKDYWQIGASLVGIGVVWGTLQGDIKILNKFKDDAEPKLAGVVSSTDIADLKEKSIEYGRNIALLQQSVEEIKKSNNELKAEYRASADKIEGKIDDLCDLILKRESRGAGR